MIKPYDEALVAELPDYLTAPIDSSLDLLRALHVRWAELVRKPELGAAPANILEPGFGREHSGPHGRGLHWHGRHHLAHVERLIERENWA